MIITRTPYRVSLFGGGSDYPQWYLQHGGSVLGFAINRYCYITLRHLPPFFEHKHRIVYSKVENVSDIAEIQHPCVRAVMSELKIETGIEMHHDGDLPARSGLGSSSSFTVGLLNAFSALNGQLSSADCLAKEAIRIEQKVIRENVGSQDQIWAAHGGINRIDFSRNGTFTVNPMILPPERIQALMDHVMLFFTGFSRFASDMAGKKIANLDAKAQNIRAMVGMVGEAQGILMDSTRPILDLGHLLHESWMCKRELADCVTTPEIDAIYAAGREAGAVGGKLLGAGGGGFMLFVVAPEKRDTLREKLKSLIEVKINVDHAGSRIVFYSPGGLAGV